MSAQLAHTALGLFCYSNECFLEEGTEGEGINLISRPILFQNPTFQWSKPNSETIPMLCIPILFSPHQQKRTRLCEDRCCKDDRILSALYENVQQVRLYTSSCHFIPVIICFPTCEVFLFFRAWTKQAQCCFKSGLPLLHIGSVSLSLTLRLSSFSIGDWW